MKTAEEYVDLVDRKYKWAKEKGYSRFSVEWGKWSRNMNLETRKRIEADDPQAIKLKYVYVYWLNRSNLLELHHKSKGRWRATGRKKRLVREGERIKKMILTGSGLEDISEEDLTQRLLGALGKG